MKLTNRQGLPQALVDAIANHSHQGADYSASMLTSSPRQLWLKKRHQDELSEDVSDRIWAIFGTAVHAIIEQASPENSLTEEYMEKEILPGVKISGKPDLYKDGIISDWKTVSVWSLVFLDDEKIHEYESQLNTYAYLFRNYGFEVKGLEIIMLMRDWQASKAKFDPQYPQSQVHRLPIKLWSHERAEDYIIGRIESLEAYRDTPDNELPECTEKERWAKPSKWALMKTGRKSAIKLYDTKPEIELEAGQYLEERPGEQWKRCEYCDGASFCNQYLNAIGGKE